MLAAAFSSKCRTMPSSNHNERRLSEQLTTRSSLELRQHRKVTEQRLLKIASCHHLPRISPVKEAPKPKEKKK